MVSVCVCMYVCAGWIGWSVDTGQSHRALQHLNLQCPYSSVSAHLLTSGIATKTQVTRENQCQSLEQNAQSWFAILFS